MTEKNAHVERLVARREAITHVASELRFPWTMNAERRTVSCAAGHIVAEEVHAPEPFPAFSRSTRDGYAVRSLDVIGATASSPVFLSLIGDVRMGETPSVVAAPATACAIPTGGVLPAGYDAVVMMEDAEAGGPWIEIRRSVQRGENVVAEGEEIAEGDLLLSPGERVDSRTVGLLAALGIRELSVVDVRIAVLSTGDELVPSEETPPPGRVRDTNAHFLATFLQELGFRATIRGIVPDDREALDRALFDVAAGNDVVLLSGGSSIGMRDFCAAAIGALSSPGLIVRGINMSPGKPTLIGGTQASRRLVLGLPGHPLSCAVVARTVVVPLLKRMTGGEEIDRFVRTRIAQDLPGKTGVEEFIPGVLLDGSIHPLPAKSGYVGAFRKTDGLIRLPECRETARRGEEVDFLPW